jgi:hypothetical protein
MKTIKPCATIPISAASGRAGCESYPDANATFPATGY